MTCYGGGGGGGGAGGGLSDIFQNAFGIGMEYTVVAYTRRLLPCTQIHDRVPLASRNVQNCVYKAIGQQEKQGRTADFHDFNDTYIIIIMALGAENVSLIKACILGT